MPPPPLVPAHSRSTRVHSWVHKPLLPLCPLPAPGHHSCTFCLHGFASSNASYEWNHVMRGLLSLNSFMYAFLQLLSLAPRISISHLWWLKKQLLYGYITIGLSIHPLVYLFLPFGYCGEWCYEHAGVCICLGNCVQPLRHLARTAVVQLYN